MYILVFAVSSPNTMNKNNFSLLTVHCHMSPVFCYLSHVVYLLKAVTCHLSHICLPKVTSLQEWTIQHYIYGIVCVVYLNYSVIVCSVRNLTEKSTRACSAVSIFNLFFSLVPPIRKEGSCECYSKYIEENCFNLFLHILWTPRCHLATIAL